MYTLTQKVPDCSGERFVISDIHGCINTFKTLVEKIHLAKNDQLFLLGDYIDRGNDSKAVIDFIVELQKENYQIFPIRGNHEEDLLKYNSLEDKLLLLPNIINLSRNNLIEKNFEIEKKYIDFLNSLPYFFELDKFWIVHAGFDFNLDNTFEETFPMLWIRNFAYNRIKAKNKTIIHGHNPTQIDIIKKNIEKRAKIIPLDNGCVYYPKPFFGKLLCLNLKTFELTEQINID